nr:hypothetical protein [Brevibacillus sp. HB1.3]
MKMHPKEDWILLPCPSIIDEVKFEHAQRLIKESIENRITKVRQTTATLKNTPFLGA